MKTLLKLSFYLIVAMLAFTSCKKDDDNKPSESSNNTGNGTGNNTQNNSSAVVGVWVATDVKGEIKPKAAFSEVLGADFNMVDFIKAFFVGTEIEYKSDGTVKIVYSLEDLEEFVEEGEGEGAGTYEVKEGVITIYNEAKEVFMKGKLQVSGSQKTITVSADEQVKLIAEEEEESVANIKAMYDVSDIEYVYTKK